MHSTLLVVTGMAAIAVAVGLFQVAGLCFRNPLRPKWLNIDFVGAATAVGFTALMAVTVANEIAALVIAGANPFLAIAMAPAMIIVAGYLIWRAFRMGERLRQADHSQSPFHLASKRLPQMRGPRPAA